MNYSISISRIFFAGLCLVIIIFPTAGRAEVRMAVAPYVEYAYLTDTDGAVPVLDRINETVGGWLVDYNDFELFNQLFLVGAEFRIGMPDRWRGLELSLSVSGAAGSASMFGEEYDESVTLPDLPDMPIFSSLLTIDGTVRTRVDQYLDYAIPLQLGVRYERERVGGSPFVFFGSLCGGPVFVKGGMDIDIKMDGTADVLGLSETFDGKIDAKASLKDTGWLASLMAGIRYDWNERISSSLAAGYGLGKVRNNVKVRGLCSAGSEDLGEVNIPLNFSEPLNLKLNGFRLRCELMSWRW